MRISQGPHAALSIAETASAEEVRAAFLQLTKQFHPARFGRYAPDVLKMANEVFLGIKGAHDQLTKLLGSTGRPAPRSSQPPPTGGTGGTVRGTGLVPKPGFGRGTTDPLNRGTDRGGTEPLNRGTERGADPLNRGTERGTDPLNRGSDLIRGTTRPSSPAMPTPPAGSPRAPSPPGRPATPQATQPMPARPGTPQATQPMPARPGTPQATQPMSRAPTPAIGVPIQRPSTPPADGGKRPTPIGGVPTQPRPTSPAGAVRPITPSTQRTPSPPVVTPPTIRYGAQSSSSSGSLPKQSTEEVELQHAMSLLSSKDWTAARLAFHTLAAKIPQSRQYRALLCYARGRETQATGRPDDAAMEFQRALQLDPDLELAKVALRELGRKSRW